MKILYVEDNDKIAKFTSESLRLSGYVVELVDSYEEAERITEQDSYDVIVLDRMLPNNRDGLELCRVIKARGDQTPILILTALAGPDSRIKGYSNGADDYLEKPFKIEELLARIQNITRRSTDTQPFLHIGKDVVVDLPGCILYVDNKEVQLSKRLWRLLEYMLLHTGQTISKEILIDRVWGMESDILENTVEVAIRQLRLKLGKHGAKHIRTIHGLGYRLVHEV